MDKLWIVFQGRSYKSFDTALAARAFAAQETETADLVEVTVFESIGQMRGGRVLGPAKWEDAE